MLLPENCERVLFHVRRFSTLLPNTGAGSTTNAPSWLEPPSCPAQLGGVTHLSPCSLQPDPTMAHRTSLPGFDSLPLLLHVEEVADLLRLSRKAVYAMVERDEIPGVTKLGRRLRFRRDALEAWLVDASAK